MMTPRKERFCYEYIIDLNAAQAAIRAGYSPRTAKSQGQRLLTDVDVRTLIERLKAERLERAKVTADEVLIGMSGMFRTDMGQIMRWGPNGGEVFDSEGLDTAARASVQSVKVRRQRLLKGSGEDAAPWEVEDIEVRLVDRIRIADLLMRHLGLLTERVEHSGAIGGDVAAVERLIADPEKARLARELLRGVSQG